MECKCWNGARLRDVEVVSKTREKRKIDRLGRVYRVLVEEVIILVDNNDVVAYAQSTIHVVLQVQH